MLSYTGRTSRHQAVWAGSGVFEFIAIVKLMIRVGPGDGVSEGSPGLRFLGFTSSALRGGICLKTE